MKQTKRKTSVWKPLIAAITIVVVMALVAVAWLATEPPSTAESPEIVLDTLPIVSPEPGWQTFPEPRTFDYPGSMFALDPDKHWRPLPAAGKTYEKQGSILVPTVTVENKWTVQALSRYSGVRSADLGSTANNVVTASVEFSGGSRYYDPEFYPKTRKKALTSVEFLPKWRYFIIEATDSFTSISVTVHGQRTGGSRASLLFTRIAAALGFKSSSTIEKHFSNPLSAEHNVFFLAQEILPPIPGGFSGSGAPRTKRLTERLIYKPD